MDKSARNTEIIANIRSILERRGLSQRDFASLLGRKESEVSRWLAGKVNISKSSLKIIETALGEAVCPDSEICEKAGAVRIGVIGTGSIAGRFVQESHFVKDIIVCAAYNPDINESILFCEKYSIEHYCSSPEDLISNVDAVYIASPISSHYYYSKLALESNRHVLCEVPFTYSVSEASELIRIASVNNLVLMLALKTAYCPSFLQMVLMAKTGLIGQVVDVSATVTNLLPENSRVDFSNERIAENTTYPLLAFFKLLGLDYKKCKPFIKRDADRILYANTSLEYQESIGCMKIGVGVKSEGSLVVSGTKGYIYVPAPWWKPDYFEIRFENPADNKKYFFPYEASGLRYELQVFKDKICRLDAKEYVSKREMLKMIEVQNIIFNKL